MKSSSFIKASVTTLLSAVICACQKDNTNKIAETANAIEGEYELIAMHWDGNPIDINGDDIVTNDILPEMMSLSSNSNQEFQAEGYPMTKDRSKGGIQFTLPMQGVSINYYSGVFNKSALFGDSMNCISLSYEINDDGNLEFEHFDSIGMPEGDSRVEMNEISDGTVTFDFNGNLLFSVNYTLYDYKTDQLVTNRLHYTFKKK